MIRAPKRRMTIAQLKRHMDRRFAMTNKRLQRCATKEDLQRCATKEDLQRFATNATMDRQMGALDVKLVDRDRIVDNHENRLCDLEAQARH